MKTLYFDCYAGASGDMILGALVDAGVSLEKLNDELRKLNVSDFALTTETVDRSGISATKVNVEVPHEHAHRHLRDIEKIINDSDLSESVKQRAVKIFTVLAEAEAKVHGTSVEKIHFHEVGAMDAIIDVVGACIGFEILGVEKFVCSRIHIGSGFVKMAHGKFPVPPPAVAEILQSKNALVYQTEIEGELLTPTGAAIIAAVCDEFGVLPEMTIEKTAYGAGGREYQNFPNVLRLIIGKAATDTAKKKKAATDYMDKCGLENGLETETNPKFKIQNPKSVDNLLLLETNIDDLSPEILGFVMERSFDAGALDCWFTPIQMKKNRPAVQISILCNSAEKEKFIELLFAETTTLGVRACEVERYCLPRETVKVATEYGEIDIKIAQYDGKIVNVKPEYDRLREIAVKSKIPLRNIEKEILKKFNER